MAEKPSQRDYMRRLVKHLGRNKQSVCRAYAQGEIKGEVGRDNNASGLSAEQYAEALWADGERKGWLDA